MRNVLCFCLMVLVLNVAAQESAPPDLFRWKATTPLAEPRAGACAVKLRDGRVLVAGGDSGNGPINSSELYTQGEGFVMAGYMTVARAGHTCTVLDDGRVLAYGGGEAADVYDPTADRWERLNTRGPARRKHTATRTTLGDVIFAGGETTAGVTGTLERWNQAAGVFELLASTLSSPRKEHAATLLPDGRVFFTGGSDGSVALAVTEILDPAADQLENGPELPRARSGHAAVLLHDDRVLIAGGAGIAGELAEAEIYTPSEGRIAVLPALMKTPRRDHLTLFLEGNGAVLFAGGSRAGEATGTSEMFQPWEDQFVEAGALTLGRSAIAGVMMDGGEVLAIGGATLGSVTGACGVLLTPTVDLYVSRAAGPRPAALEGEKVTVEAANWGGFQKAFRLTAQRRDGTQFDASGQLMVSGTAFDSFRGELFTAPDFQHGYRYLLTVRDLIKGTAAQAAIDIKQETLSLSSGGTAMVGFPFRLPVSIQAVRPETTPTVVPVGERPVDNGLLTASLPDPVGRITRIRPFSTPQLPQDTPFVTPFGTDVELCCATTPGFYRASFAFVSSRNYFGSQGEASVPVVDNLPLFSMSNPSFTLGVAESHSVLLSPPVNPFPSLAGTALLNRGATPAVSMAISSSGGGPLTIYTPNASEMTGICFTVQYSGNSSYKPLRDTQCYPVNPTPSSISISTPSNSYLWGSAIDIPAILNWTAPDARFVNQAATITARSGTRSRTVGTITLNKMSNTSASTAAGASSWVLPMGVTQIEVTYAGSGDIRSATSATPISMQPVPSSTTLATPTAVNRSVTLSARVTPAVKMQDFWLQPFYAGPSGSMRFFDGATLLGSAMIPANTEVAPQASITVNVAAGAHSFKAVFVPGNSLYTGSESDLRALSVP